MKEHHYAGLSIFIGLAGVAVGGGYWYWEWHRRKVQQEEREARRGKEGQLTQALSRAPALTQPPDAQSTPVPPPTLATIKQIQHWLNVIGNKHPGQSGYIPESGSGDNHTWDAIRMFQTAHGMTPTGKMDGMTQSLLQQVATKTVGGDEGPFHFHLFWQATPQLGSAMAGHWALQDSMHFVTEVPGFTKNSPPPEHVLTALLTKHYGSDSPVGVAIREQRFDGWCTGCPVPVGYGMSRGTTTTKGSWDVDPWAIPQSGYWPQTAPMAPAYDPTEWEWSFQ